MTLKEEIRKLAAERNAVILAHNYTLGEVQDVADYTGDSLELARKAATVDADVIVFCGVYFMAETAAILNPGKTVLIPDADAGCAMADMIDGRRVQELKCKLHGSKVVCYVNSTAEVKAECDMCVTSGNAERVMKTFGADEKIIFVPDQHLGGYIAGKLGREYLLWNGCCPIHQMITPELVAKARAEHPGAPVLVHPECPAEVRNAADHALSTGGMCAFARESDAKEIIIGTEIGILHRLRKENPEKKFYPVSETVICPDMKKTTLENLAACLREMKEVVTVPESVATRARRTVEAMLSI